MGTTTQRILILGGGFGGIYAALELEKAIEKGADVDVTLITRENHFLFTPMLHEVAASDLEVSAVVSPVRKLLRRVRTFVGDVQAIDLGTRSVRVTHGLDGHDHDLGYDHLIVGLGATTNFFGVPGIADSAITLRSLADAMRLRNRLIAHLEEAGSECGAGSRETLLTIVVTGGGFAGVETAGAINDFLHEALPFYPDVRRDHVRLMLVSSDAIILPELAPRLGRYAARKLAARGIEVLAGVKVKSVAGNTIVLSDGRAIEASTLVWTAGNAANPIVANLPVPTKGGRLLVNEYLAVPDVPGLWAVGDCAVVPDLRTGGVHPPTAQHALREGKQVARNVLATIRGEAPRPFRFRTLGQLAAIGRRTGVANVFGINFSGFVAWWLWRTIYLGKLPRIEKKVRVAIDWTLDLCFAKDFACVTMEHVPPAAERRLDRGAA